MSSKHETRPLTRITHEIELSSIQDNPKPVRYINDAAVASLAESFRAVALSGYAATLLERAAAGIETCGETSVYAKRVRRSARVLAQRAQRMTDELMLVTECTCSDGCSSCGSLKALLQSIFKLSRPMALSNQEIRDPDLSSDVWE